MTKRYALLCVFLMAAVTLTMVNERVPFAQTITNQSDLRRETDQIFNETLEAWYSRPLEIQRPISNNEQKRVKSYIEKLKKALIGYQKLGDKAKQAYILSTLGRMCHDLDENIIII